jgi:O-antigen ligase
MLASTVAFGALGVYALIATRNVRAVLPIVLIGAVVAAFFVPAFVERTFQAGMPTLADIREAIRDPLEIAYFMNLSGREVLWAVVIAGFLGSPILGLGLGGSSALLEATFPAEVGHIAHNEYLRVVADTGLIGLGLFAMAMLTWGWGVLRGLRAPGANTEYTLPALAVFLSWAVISAADNTIDYYAAFSQYVGFLAAAAVFTVRRAEDGAP